MIMMSGPIRKNIVLIIRDGWGINHNPEYNAVMNANTPNADMLLKRYPYAILKTSGTAVGLPAGYQGSSEVGHLIIGAGRVIPQELKRINDRIKGGTFFKNPNFQRVVANCLSNRSSLHLMGLIQDAGVHAHQDHLFAVMKYLKEKKIKKVYIHFFSDGRDTAPRSALQFLRVVNEKMREYQIGEIATLMGRYYAMDRGKIWNLTTRSYDALTRAKGRHVTSAEEAIKRAYNEDKTPDATPMTDEYIPPSIIGDFSGIKDGDSVIHLNYRQDRAIQLTMAFVEDNYPGERWKKLDITYCGLTRYYDTFPFHILEPINESISNTLGEILSKKGLRQLRIAETQKFRHVTSFFNGKRIKPYPKEVRIEIKSSYDPATFAEHPEMNAFDVTKEVINRIESEKYNLIVLNYANCDMVGHTGNYDAAKKAVEVVDECVSRVINKILLHNGVALITADHGNAEEMIDYQTKLPKTSHTTNPVEFIYVAKDYEKVKIRGSGYLSDIAPTLLYLLGINPPKEMTGKSLILI